MTQYDFKPPQSLKDGLQRFSLELNCMMVWLRNEARYHYAMDQSVLDTAQLVVNLLDDTLNEAMQLMPMIEALATGANQPDRFSC